MWGLGFRVSGTKDGGVDAQDVGRVVAHEGPHLFRFDHFNTQSDPFGTQRFRGELVLKAHRLWCHSTPGSRVIKKNKIVDLFIQLRIWLTCTDVFPCMTSLGFSACPLSSKKGKT